MTNREFYTAIAKSENEELKAFAEAALEKMDAAAAKRREAPRKPSKAAIENMESAQKLLEAGLITDEPQTAQVIADAFGVTAPKFRAIVAHLIQQGKVTFGPEAKGANGKGKVKTYVLVEDGE